MNADISFHEVPTEDDPGAEELTLCRTVGRADQFVPCRWGLLDNARTRQDVRDLVFSTLVGLQSIAFMHFGGKFPYLFNEFGWPRTGWDMNFSDGTVSEKLSVAVPVCKLAMYFIRTFQQLVAKFGTSDAVNLVDGIVTQQDGLADTVGLLVQHFLNRDVSEAHLKHQTLEGQKIILGDCELLIERDVVLQNNLDSLTNDTHLSNVVFRKCPSLSMDSRPLKMIKLALDGYLWNTDRETSSILRAVCPTFVKTVGAWEPLSRLERDRMRTLLNRDGQFRVIGTGVWVQRVWGRHTLLRREAFYERVEPSSAPVLGFACMPTCEQISITNRVVKLLSWMRDRPQEWAEDLFNDLHHLKSQGIPAKGEEVSRAIELARTKASVKHGDDDDCFDMMFGPINTGYSFACESTDVSQFAKLHYLRCLRIIGTCTSVDGIPLYALKSSHNMSEPMKSIVKDVTELDPILNDLQGRPTAQLHKPPMSEMW